MMVVVSDEDHRQSDNGTVNANKRANKDGGNQVGIIKA